MAREAYYPNLTLRPCKAVSEFALRDILEQVRNERLPMGGTSFNHPDDGSVVEIMMVEITCADTVRWFELAGSTHLEIVVNEHRLTGYAYSQRQF